MANISSAGAGCFFVKATWTGAAVPTLLDNLTMAHTIDLYATVTMTIASPCKVTLTGHGIPDGTPVCFTTTGALPTGLTASSGSTPTVYYTKNAGTNDFEIEASIGGGSINTSGSQSGTHTILFRSPIQYGTNNVTSAGHLRHGAYGGMRCTIHTVEDHANTNQWTAATGGAYIECTSWVIQGATGTSRVALTASFNSIVGWAYIAAASTNSTSIVFPSTVSLSTGQTLTIKQGTTNTIRGTCTVTTGGTGTTFTVSSVTGMTSGDVILTTGETLSTANSVTASSIGKWTISGYVLHTQIHTNNRPFGYNLTEHAIWEVSAGAHNSVAGTGGSITMSGALIIGTGNSFTIGSYGGPILIDSTCDIIGGGSISWAIYYTGTTYTNYKTTSFSFTGSVINTPPGQGSLRSVIPLNFANSSSYTTGSNATSSNANGVSFTTNGTSCTVTNASHGLSTNLSVGSSVQITVSNNTSFLPLGTYMVKTVPNSSTFTFDVVSTAGTSTCNYLWIQDLIVMPNLAEVGTATTGTTTTSIVFSSTVTLTTGQILVVMNDATTTIRGKCVVASGGTGTTFTVSSVTGLASGDKIRFDTELKNGSFRVQQNSNSYAVYSNSQVNSTIANTPASVTYVIGAVVNFKLNSSVSLTWNKGSYDTWVLDGTTAGTNTVFIGSPSQTVSIGALIVNNTIGVTGVKQITGSFQVTSFTHMAGTLDCQNFTITGTEDATIASGAKIISKNTNGLVNAAGSLTGFANIIYTTGCIVENQETNTWDGTKFASDSAVKYIHNGSGKTASYSTNYNMQDMTVTAGAINSSVAGTPRTLTCVNTGSVAVGASSKDIIVPLISGRVNKMSMDARGATNLGNNKGFAFRPITLSSN
jgi:hypothetical protein